MSAATLYCGQCRGDRHIVSTDTVRMLGGSGDTTRVTLACGHFAYLCDRIF